MVAVSEVAIANSCFRKIGVKQKIGTFDEGTAAANFANDRYRELRDDLLRSHNWNFAIKRAKLAKLSTGPTSPSDWNYFQLPADWIRTVGIFDNDAGISSGFEHFHEDDKKISAGREELWITYVYGVEDPNAMTPDFREALAYAMAVEGAIDLVGSRTLSETMEARFDRKVNQARGTDSMTDGPRFLPRGSWVSQRVRSSSNSITTS